VVTPRFLLLGVGNGRNIPALLANGGSVDAIEEDPARAGAVAARFAGEPRVRIATAPYAGKPPFGGSYDGALSTNALLHGSQAGVRAALAGCALALRAGAPLYLVLGSRSDPRFGRGRRLDDAVFAPTEGPEADVPHVYFDAAGVRELLADFALVALDETSAAETAGRWAHDASDAAHIVHWFVRARAPSTGSG